MKASGSASTPDVQYVEKWSKFINKNPLNQPKVWQYWRDDVRPKSQFNKKFINRFNKGIKSQQKAKALIRAGIPESRRGEVWWACSGGAELMAAAQQSYCDYLDLSRECSDNPAAESIIKDLHRTVITKELADRNSINVQSTDKRPRSVAVPPVDDAILPLKNILMAYSMRNPEVGYCQSMNFICAMLLLYLDEEQAFWVLTAIVETILLRDYYAPSMLGSRVDQLTFQSCLAWKLPRVFSHLRELDIILEPILCQWFLCLFVHVLPLDAVQRIWDCFFFEGNVVLFRIGLAICKLLETDILNSGDVATIFLLLKKPFGSDIDNEFINTLMITAFDKTWLGSIPRATLQHFRSQHILTLSNMANVGEDCDKDASVFDIDQKDVSKKKSATVYSGVERSLASVIQSDSFRGKIDQRKNNTANDTTSEIESNHRENDDIDNNVEGEADDEEEEILDPNTRGECEDIAPLEVSSISFKPPKSRRTSVAMKSLLLAQSLNNAES